MPPFELRGPVAEHLFLPLIEGRWDDLEEEQCYWGAAGTAKSFEVMAAFILFMLQDEIGGFRLLWCRKTRKAITQSSIETNRKVHEALGIPWSAKPDPTNRQVERYYTKAGVNTIIWCGMDNPLNLFSSEYDAAVTEEGIQVSLDTYENSVLRTLRNFAVPKQISLVLTNPGPKASWPWKRMNVPPRGKTAPLMVSHETTRYHNPAYYAPDGTILPMGKAYEATLDRYTGTRRLRLKDGQWVAEEGMVLDNWNDDLHVYAGEFVKVPYRNPFIELTESHSVLPDRIEIDWTFASMDLGYVNAGVLICWGVTPQGHLLQLDEVYHTRKDRDWWTERIWERFEEFHLDSIVCDWDQELHDHWNATIEERAPTHQTRDDQPFVRKCEKTHVAGKKDQMKVDVVRTLLNEGPDGKPRTYLLQGARRHKPDPELLEEALPTCLEEEIPQLIWKPLDADKALDKMPEEKLADRPNHGFDTWVYAGRYIRQRDLTPDWRHGKPAHVPGSFEAHKAHMERKWSEEDRTA